MEQKPVFTVEGVAYVYVQYNNLILMSVTKRNSNVALMLVYLYKLVRGLGLVPLDGIFVFRSSMPPAFRGALQ